MSEFFEVPSPFCGIGTDDLTIKVDGLKISVIENGCAVNTPAFEQPITDTKARVNGKEVELKEAVIHAASLLKNTNYPVIGGCATDVNGMRGLLALADRTGAVVDNMNFNNARKNILALQDVGWMNTTLAEVKNRCDVLLIVGADLEGFAPRFFEKYLWNDAMFLENTSDREIIYLGTKPSGNASTSPSGKIAQVFECATENLPEVVTVLRALVKGQPIQAESVAGISIADLQAIAEKLKNAKYGVVTWAAGALNYSHAELTVQTISEMVKDLNQTTRCSGFPLGGKEGDQTANQVCGWTTGYAARVSFAKGYPEYDPFLFETNALLDNGEADALVWVNAFNAKANPPKTSLPTIVVARSGMTFEKEPDVFIPVGTPAIDHAGHAFRLDNVVAIRLKKLRDSGLPSTADVLNAIEKVLREESIC
ncbi:MAG: formylmethanofuran dehydrogenase subunit B [Methylococcales bacterium]|nr:formylmethanofuran dehydrogenase subunit B [Methylococcales bacterium]MDD5753368.1 formylmethanofuran dehydrogenase subunit B [Methylococcales bacterium]